MGCVLFSRPKHDNTVNYLYHYSRELVKLSNSLQHDTINKEHTEANKKVILSIIMKKKPDLIMFNGHGSPEVICGHNNEVLISSRENLNLLRDKIIYSLSCSSASVLGSKAIKGGAKCFIGYELDFALGKDPKKQASPRKDRIAKLFLEPSNLLFASLLKGNSAKQSVEKAKKMMDENLWFLNTTQEFPEASDYAPFLFGNYLGLIAHGDDNASLN